MSTESKFTAALRGLPCDSRAVLYNVRSDSHHKLSVNKLSIDYRLTQVINENAPEYLAGSLDTGRRDVIKHVL